MDPNLNTAIYLGLLEKDAASIPPTDLNNTAGKILTANYGTTTIDYKVVTTIYGNDLATDLNLRRGEQIVSFGLVLQASNNDVVIAIRGTDGIWEWIHDAEFGLVPCPFLAGAGNTEDGFTALYKSLRISEAPDSMTIVDALRTLPFNKPVGSMTIIGHSLGGALATLMALDLAANTSFRNPTVYTYASPRTGDALFARTYNSVVPNTVRIAHRPDIVPKLPLPPLYEHVQGFYELSSLSVQPFPSLPKLLVKPDVGCWHHLTTYLHLLSLKGGGTILPLDSDCNP